MIDYEITAGATSRRIGVWLADSSSTTGGGLTGLVFNSAGLTCYYWREDEGNAGATAVTLATATRGTFTSSGFIEKDATNFPGAYEFGIPNAAIATGAKWVKIMFKGAANLAQRVITIKLSLLDTDTASTPQTGDNFARLGAPTGASVSADIAAVKVDTAAILVDTGTTLDARIPAALVGGRMDSSVGAMAAGVITAAAHAAGAIDAAAIAADAGAEIADALLDRNMATGTDSGSPTVRTVRQALRASRNRVAIAGGTATIYKEDDATASWTSTITTAAGNPISESNPADA